MVLYVIKDNGSSTTVSSLDQRMFQVLLKYTRVEVSREPCHHAVPKGVNFCVQQRAGKKQEVFHYSEIDVYLRLWIWRLAGQYTRSYRW